MDRPDITWVHELIGKPWKVGTEGPDTFDCWGLLRWVYRTQRSLVLTPIPAIAPTDTVKICRAVQDEEPRWQRVLLPTHLDAVAMSLGKAIHHVGVWLEIDGGVVLHTTERSGVVAQSITSLRSNGFNLIHFYTP